MNAFDDPIEETQASLSIAQGAFKQWQAGEIEPVVALLRISQAASQLEVTRAIWMETARQGVSRLSTRSERELLNFCELVKGIDNQKDYGVSLLEHVLRDALSSLESGLALSNGHEGEETVSSVLDSCTIVLAIKSALLETLSLKATIEANGQPTSQVEELKKRHAVVTSLQERLQAAVSDELPN
ncbi:hypothetical protein KA344_03155 [bacterium]|jgi:hypothetical protein|nr:hypothetical protein [bacterium]